MKNRKLIVFVSALLCAVMALSSCTGSAALPDNDVLANDPIHENGIILTDDASSGTSDVPSVDTLTASGKLAVWQKYLKYDVKSLDAASSDSTASLDDKTHNFVGADTYGVLVQTETKRIHGEFEELWKTRVEETIRVYNIFGKDEPIFSYKNAYLMNLEDESEILSDSTIVSVDTDIFYGIFRVEYENWDAVYEELPEGSTETPEIIGYTLKETYYEFYLADGTLLGEAENFWDYDTKTTEFTNAFILNGTAYVLDNDGNFIKKVAEELYTEDPFIEATYGSSEIDKIGSYYFVYDLHNEDRALIFDLNGKYVCEYNCDSEVEIFLPNGNVLMQDAIEVSEGAKTYDVYDYETNAKYDVVTKVFDVASGKVSEIEFAYIITEWYDALGSRNAALAGDCVVIEAFTFEKQMVSSELSYVALNLDLTVKEVLPEIIPNQKGLIEIRDADTVLIPATMDNDSNFYYRVTDGEFYAYDYKIISSYPGMLIVEAENEDGESCRNLIDYSGKVIIGDFVMIEEYMCNESGDIVSLLVRSYNEKDEYTSLAVCYYNAENDTVVKKTVCTVSDDDGRIVQTDSYLSGRVERVITYNSEDDRYYVNFVNVKGESVASFYADDYSYSYYTYSYDEYDVTNILEDYGDVIVLETRSEKNDRGDYIRYTTIK